MFVVVGSLVGDAGAVLKSFFFFSLFLGLEFEGDESHASAIEVMFVLMVVVIFKKI